MFEGLGKKALSAVAGFALFVFVVEGKDLLFGGCNGPSEVHDSVPAVVLGGGGDKVVVDLDLNAPGNIELEVARGEQERFVARELLDAGSYSIAFEVPAGAWFIVEASPNEPEVGDEMSWVVKLNGEVAQRSREVLDKPLPDGYGFFMQFEYETGW